MIVKKWHLMNIGIMTSKIVLFSFLYCNFEEKSLDKTVFVFWTHPCDLLLQKLNKTKTIRLYQLHWWIATHLREINFQHSIGGTCNKEVIISAIEPVRGEGGGDSSMSPQPKKYQRDKRGMQLEKSIGETHKSMGTYSMSGKQ